MKVEQISPSVGSFARAPRGLRACGSAPQNWGENITILSALNLQGMIASMIVPGSTDSDVFLAYVEEVLVPELWPGAVVLMDNLSPPTRALAYERQLKQPMRRFFTCRPTRLISILSSQAWSKLKAYLRGVAARTYRRLSAAIKTGLDLISPQDACGFFSHCGYAG